MHPSIYLCIYLSVCLSCPVLSCPVLSPSVRPRLSACLSVRLSVCLSICKLENEAFLRDFLNFWTWQRQKRITLITSKTKQFCETSSIFQVDNIKNEAILRDFLQKWKFECRADGLVPMRFAIFPLHLSKVPRLPRKSDARSYEVLHLSRKIILANLKIWCSKIQPFSGNRCPDLRTAPWWTCLLYCACHAKDILPDPLPTPAIVFGNATKPSRFAHFLTRCTIPCACQAKRHLNVQTRSEPVSFLHFWLRNVLRATTAYTFSTSQLLRVLRDRQDFWLWNVLWVTTACAFSTCQLPKTVRHWCVLYILTSKCASPQRCALFRHRNFQKCSDVGVLCTFWLGNVLRATTACTLSSLIWPHGSAPAALASLLFDPPEPQIIGKTQGFATFFLFHVPASFSSHVFYSLFFFLRLFFSLILPTFAFTSVHIVGNF